uniref:NocS5 n=1 Tax=Nocardia sp. ATCC 202099 TaxID=930400 RepID=E5DUG9_9NOCA|nr:nocS5 [Nocardia sp. ATCC 202099]
MLARGAIGARLAESAASGPTAVEPPDVHAWLAEQRERAWMHVERVPLADLRGWAADPETGDIGHRSGKFFTVHGIDVRDPAGPVPGWSQPIINQPEVGVLGIAVAEFDGVLHLLMQAKAEPGNCNGVQLSPTVQATRSNYTRVHGGAAVPYLEHFLEPDPARVIADVRQSEQGAWFLRKRNRNMVIELDSSELDSSELDSSEVDSGGADGSTAARDGFCWLTLATVRRLLAEDDLINMDARTVLSCLPLPLPGEADDGSLHPTRELLSWITSARTAAEIDVRRSPLRGLTGWSQADGAIRHDSGLFFEVVGVSVRACGREVAEWTQPMLAVRDVGLVAFLVRRIGGVQHALLQVRPEPGCLDVAELAPTVQCTPANYGFLPAEARPRFLDAVLSAPAERVLFDATMSEEGGRFYHARTRYLVVEDSAADTGPTGDLERAGFKWVALHQAADLVRHSHYLNIQARSLLACLPGRADG